MIRAAEELGKTTGIAPARDALGVFRATLYRRRIPETPRKPARRHSSRALSSTERQSILETLNSKRFMVQVPTEVYAKLLDEGHYLCSIRAMYRLLEENQQVRERRNQLRHPKHVKPELVARRPNEVLSWDITKLKGPQKWSCYRLYVIFDLYSRYVVGLMVAERESAALAKRLISETCEAAY